jgi:hypothetical protein
MCLFFHKWKTTIHYVGLIKKFGRLERLCEDCGERQIKLDQFSQKVQKEILKRKEKKEYLTYKKNDFLDIYTKYILTQKIDQ